MTGALIVLAIVVATTFAVWWKIRFPRPRFHVHGWIGHVDHLILDELAHDVRDDGHCDQCSPVKTYEGGRLVWVHREQTRKAP